MTTKQTNLGTAERVARVVAGGLLAGISLILLLQGTSWWSGGLEVAAIALGLDFVYTGVKGYCPFYNKLGWSTMHQARRPR